MIWEDYNERIREFCIYPDADTSSDLEMTYLTLGLASEAGEVAGLWKKAIRDGTDNFDRDKWLGELGDVVWYLTRLLDSLGMTLDEAMEANVEKLSSRKARGVIAGSGDNR